MKTYNKINIMLPTYKRVEKLERFINSVSETVDNIEHIRFTFCVNKNDQDSLNYLNGNRISSQYRSIIQEKTEQPNLSLYFNLMYDKTPFHDAVVTMLGDDMIFKTKGWDSIILDKINKADGKTILFCNDDFVAKDKCAVNLFTTREVVELQKKPFMCEHFHADMIDYIWTLIGLMTGILEYLPDVIIQHNHSTKLDYDKWDETFKRLSPVQKIANSDENRQLAVSYATYCARNIIEGGIGSWNTLQ